ncbi:MAG: 5-formyltetrahydrofolate cyclo-ligase [Armatimonadota bacterium]
MAGSVVTVTERKRALRREVLARRNALSPEEVAERSERIVRRVLAVSGYRRSRSRLLFASVGSEVRTERLVADTLRSGARLVLPRVRGPEESLALHEVSDPATELRPGAFGIPEPVVGNCPELSVYDLDFILVPGLAFDRTGGRLGHGGGYFDYILSLRNDLLETGAAVAVAFSVQLVDEVPREAWDVRVPIIVTEDEVIDTRKSRS